MKRSDFVEQPRPQRVYGGIVYWLSIVAALVCLVGPVITIAFPAKNVMDPHSLFSKIWAGNSPDAIWRSVPTVPPGGHFWLHTLPSGDAIIQLGLELGCCSAGIALLATSLAYLSRRPRSYGWAIGSFVIAVLVALAAVGIYQQAA